MTILDRIAAELDAEWRTRAACRGAEHRVFFPSKFGGDSHGREAKAICATCPVKAECADFALDNHERFGIWGGLSEQNRKNLRRRRRPA